MNEHLPPDKALPKWPTSICMIKDTNKTNKQEYIISFVIGQWDERKCILIYSSNNRGG
jgi:hypothetical protein